VETGSLDPSGDNGVKMLISLSPVGVASVVEVTFVVAAAHRVRACQLIDGDPNVVRICVENVDVVHMNTRITAQQLIRTAGGADGRAIFFGCVVLRPVCRICRIDAERNLVEIFVILLLNVIIQRIRNKKPEGNYISARIGKHIIDALIDSGAVRSLISEPAAKFLKLKI